MVRVRFSDRVDSRDLPMGRLNIKQRLSMPSSPEPEKLYKPKTIINDTIQIDRWDSSHDDPAIYASMVEAISVYNNLLQKAFWSYVHTGKAINKNTFRMFEVYYNIYLDNIEDSIYLNLDSESLIESGSISVDGKSLTDVPFQNRDDMSSIKTTDSCHCEKCYKDINVE